jgi:hypothetical protein
MKVRNSKVLCLSAVFVGLVIAGAGIASAQDVYKVNHFENNGATVTVTVPANAAVASKIHANAVIVAPPKVTISAPDATVRIDNPGLTYSNLCAMIYVFAADQQLSECCGCIETHNGLRTLSVHTDLTGNPLTGIVPTNGVIKVVSATPNPGCNPAAGVAPKANLRVWVTHIQNAAPLGSFGGLVFPTTETESSDSTLGSTELANLQSQCAFIGILGSGAGICSCGTGD